MDALIEGFKIFAPIVVAIVTVIAFVWKVPSKKDMQRGDDALRTSMNNLSDRIDANSRTTHAEISKLNDKMDANFHTVYADTRKLVDRIDANSDKIDANFQTVYADVRKLNDKVESYSQATHERIDNASTELRAEIRTMNQNYIDHLARHEDQALKARETQGD